MNMASVSISANDLTVLFEKFTCDTAASNPEVAWSSSALIHPLVPVRQGSRIRKGFINPVRWGFFPQVELHNTALATTGTRLKRFFDLQDDVIILMLLCAAITVQSDGRNQFNCREC